MPRPERAVFFHQLPEFHKLKEKLKNLMIKFEDNKSLADFRKITDTDFGRIVDNIKDEESVQQILTKKEN